MIHRVAVHGGSSLDGHVATFARCLGRAIAADTRLTLVTGGFRDRVSGEGADADPTEAGPTSTDCEVVEGAREHLGAGRPGEGEWIETWLPSEFNRGSDDARYFRAGAVRSIDGATPQARRFVLVKGVDAVVTVEGKANTAQVLDLALAINRSALPLPFTGADSASARYWRRNRPQIQKWFALSGDEWDGLEAVDLGSLDDAGMTELAERVVTYLWRGIERRCLALLPFDEESKEFFAGVVQRVIEDEGLVVDRVDLEPEGGEIYDKFTRSLAAADVVLVDITGFNRNVMYELGHVHAKGVSPLLYQRVAIDVDPAEIPFYLKPHAIVTFESGAGPTLVEDFQARLRKYVRKILPDRPDRSVDGQKEVSR